MRRGSVVAALILLLPAALSAATPGLTISPAVTQVVVAADQTHKGVALTLTNNATTAQSLRATVVDFGTLDETGGLFLIGQPNDFERKYGLANWVTLEKNQLTLQPGEHQSLQVTINNQASLSPGGHYAAVLFTADTGQGSTTADNINLKPVLTELMFIQKEGGSNFDLRLAGFNQPGGWFSVPSQVSLRFQNAGNVHVVPRGLVILTDPSGHEVSRGVINVNSAIVLPESIRQLSVPLTGEHAALLPGRYHVQILYRFDGKDAYSVADYYFNYLNIAALVGALAIPVLGTAVVTWLVRRWLRRRKA